MHLTPKEIEILDKAYRKIFDEGKWCREFEGADMDNNPVRNLLQADKLCAAGAVRWAFLDQNKYDYYSSVSTSWRVREYLERTARALYKNCLTGVNDDLGHEAVMKVFETALKNANEGLQAGGGYSDYV